ncbi:MAG: glycosyltransferase family 4 protein, partial [Chloroflexi bacterium]|nr:glycosyltransferase family 4 protein [Chloroflexota bacterium]
FGWRALAAAREAGARTVLQLHNFRLFCAIGVAFRDGEPCYRCHVSHTLPGLRLRCRGNVSEAAVYAVGLARQQQRLFKYTDQFVTLSERHGQRLIELGLPGERSETLPNFIPSACVRPDTRAGEQTYALVSGRLVEEKGFDTAVLAARRAGVPLVVAGVGPDEARLRRLADGAEVRFAGWLEHEELAEVRARAALVLAPSRCEEACPYAVLDALAAGVPVLVSDRGGMPEMVEAEAVVGAEDGEGWARALQALWGDPQHRVRLGRAGLSRARDQFGEEGYLERLLALYRGGPTSARPGPA